LPAHSRSVEKAAGLFAVDYGISPGYLIDVLLHKAVYLRKDLKCCLIAGVNNLRTDEIIPHWLFLITIFDLSFEGNFFCKGFRRRDQALDG
jgi:hypothetical protein